MGFIDNIRESLTEVLGVEPTFRACLFGENALYLENIVGIKHFSNDEILVYLKKGELKIKGSSLYIKKYCEGDLVICGKVLGLEKL